MRYKEWKVCLGSLKSKLVLKPQQILSQTCLRWGPQPPRGSSAPVTRKIITVSDGFYSKVKCFSCEDGMNTGQLAHGI